MAQAMTDASRSRRGPKAQSKAQSALAKLAELKKGGKVSRRTDSSDEDDAPIYDVVDEADYADLVAGRKAAAGMPLLERMTTGLVKAEHSSDHSASALVAERHWRVTQATS